MKRPQVNKKQSGEPLPDRESSRDYEDDISGKKHCANQHPHKQGQRECWGSKGADYTGRTNTPRQHHSARKYYKTSTPIVLHPPPLLLS